ncbi:cellulose binding domain-containing protein [Micromonospora fiedleri]|uniref:Cellulose binding domain-containing protein n=1 Tax=Micromonospora fiedleri TaxID=1157498 RepID=A0ABS1UTE0_9ACTN|nr:MULTISPECIES: cellulose-binding domain-containing protein [Micromonospora]MBL6279633.1 cellulose binding domain-containing protein [Micromonospora fiedleri]WSK40159.1 cellulose binding domain-containing protein [Micromonospora maris]
MRSFRTGARIMVAMVATLATIGGGAIVVTAAQAAVAVACRVDYRVTSQWSGGFGADVTITNLGDPVNGWKLTWAYPAGQRVVQAWNATVTQTGTQVSATNVSYNGVLATGAGAAFGFNGYFSDSNPAPASYALNGVTCTSAPGTPTPTTPAPTTPAPTTPAPTTPPPTNPPPTSGWNPPAHLVSPLNQVWQHVEQTYNNGNLYGFRNYGWDQVMANRGYLNFCVRWDSSAPVTATQRDQIHATLARQYKKWMDVMVGHNAWPYRDVPIRVVGWAVRDRNQLQWNDNSVDVYVNNIRENAPQCAPECGRFFNQGGQYPNCPGGAARHYDQSLWLTDGFGGGAGGDWGQRMGREYFMSNLNAENMHILLHEIGHTFGLDDFYDWTPSGVGGFLMRAGSASSITEFDAWMFRDWWRHLKSRYGY